MLGLVRGRLYYNLLNWYRVLALLPGFTLNRAFMEQMMGVKRGLPDAWQAGSPSGIVERRSRAGRRCTRSTQRSTGLVVNHFTLERRMRRFLRAAATRAGAAGAAARGPRASTSSSAHYRDLRRPSAAAAGTRRS